MHKPRTRTNLANLASALPARHPLAVAARNLLVAMQADAKAASARRSTRHPYATQAKADASRAKATALWRASLALARLAGTPTQGPRYGL
jgi:hypothetical protein